MGTSFIGIQVHAAQSASTTEIALAPDPPLSLRAYVSRSRGMLLVIAVTIFGIFHPTVIVPYAFSDDYSLLWMADTGEPSPQFGKNILDATAISGRPFAGLLTQFFFSTAGTIDNLRFVRLFAILGIVALAILLHWALVRSGINPTFAAFMAILMCTLPAFQVFGSWTVLFAGPLTALLSGGGSLFAVAAADAPRNVVPDRIVGAAAMLLAALLIYQPAAMFFWVFLAVALVGARHDSRRALRLVRTHFVVAAVAAALAFIVLRLGVYYIGETATGAARNSVTHDVAGKVRWFVSEPLYRSLNLFDLTPSRSLGAIVAAVALGGILLWLLRNSARPLLYAATALVLIPLSYSPNLVVQENWAAFRTQVSISALVALYFCLGALGIWLTLKDWLKPRISPGALVATKRVALAMSVALVATSAVVAARNVTTLIVEPQITELRMLRSQVAALPTGVRRIAFVQTGWHQGMTRLVVYDEFGLATSARLWALEPAVDLILREQGRLSPRPVVDHYSWYATTFPEDEPLLDLRGLQRLR